MPPLLKPPLWLLSWLKDASFKLAILTMGNICNYPLTKAMQDDIINQHNEQKGKRDKKIITVREGEQGLYRWMNHVFSVTDEYGVEEVSI